MNIMKCSHSVKIWIFWNVLDMSQLGLWLEPFQIIHENTNNDIIDSVKWYNKKPIFGVLLNLLKSYCLDVL